MKPRRHALPALTGENLSNDFLRGLVSTGLLVAVQQGLKQPGAGRTMLGRALQGGTALASAAAAANAMQQGRTGRAVMAVALGAAGIAGIEWLMNETRTVNTAEGGR